MFFRVNAAGVLAVGVSWSMSDKSLWIMKLMLSSPAELLLESDKA